MMIPGFSGHGIDDLNKSLPVALRINSHSRNNSNGLFAISTDTFKIPAFKITALFVFALKISLFDHRSFPFIKPSILIIAKLP